MWKVILIGVLWAQRSRGVGGLALLVVLVGAVGWLRRNLLVVQVSGASMAPTLKDRNRILVRRCPIDRIQRGDIVVLASGPPRHYWLVKRVVALAGDPMPAGVPDGPARGSASVGQIYQVAEDPMSPIGIRRVPEGTVVVIGDGPMSWDSRNTGPYPEKAVIGRLVCRLLDR